jgi:trehalose 6-phosphate phosphatase
LLQLEKQNHLCDAQTRLTHFFDEVSRAASRALVLDYDGTLAPFCIDRNSAVPYPTVPPLLDQIRSSTNTRVAVATGRRADQVAALLGMPGVEIWGCHGQERLRADGTCERAEVVRQTLERLSEANGLLLAEGLSDLLEFKPASTAVHWRGVEAAADAITHRLQKVWSMLSSREGLQFAPFDGGIEIRTTTKNKGDVVRTIVNEMGRCVSIAYLGDDQTDEDAFTALQGLGLRVLVRSKERPTAADVWIRPPEGVVAFLNDWCAACGGAS